MRAAYPNQLDYAEGMHSDAHTHTHKVALSYETQRKKEAPEVRLELTTYRLTAGRAADCAIQDLALSHPGTLYPTSILASPLFC